MPVLEQRLSRDLKQFENQREINLNPYPESNMTLNRIDI